MTPHEHHISVTRTARYFVLGEPGPGTSEVWLVCHGYGQQARRFIRHFEPIDDGTRLIVAPEALSRFYLDVSATTPHTEHKIGASWMTREDRLAEIDDYVRYLDAVCEDIFERVDRHTVKLVALGFSQGVATICRWAAASGHAAPDRVICWAGGLPPELADTGGLQRLGGMGLTLVLGERDTIVTPGQVEAEADRLRGLKVPFDLVRFDGGHRIDGPSLVGLGERARER